MFGSSDIVRSVSWFATVELNTPRECRDWRTARSISTQTYGGQLRVPRIVQRLARYFAQSQYFLLHFSLSFDSLHPTGCLYNIHSNTSRLD